MVHFGSDLTSVFPRDCVCAPGDLKILPFLLRCWWSDSYPQAVDVSIECTALITPDAGPVYLSARPLPRRDRRRPRVSVGFRPLPRSWSRCRHRVGRLSSGTRVLKASVRPIAQPGRDIASLVSRPCPNLPVIFHFYGISH